MHCLLKACLRVMLKAHHVPHTLILVFLSLFSQDAVSRLINSSRFQFYAACAAVGNLIVE